MPKTITVQIEGIFCTGSIVEDTADSYVVDFIDDTDADPNEPRIIRTKIFKNDPSTPIIVSLF